MAVEDDWGLETLSRPLAYSCCASIMTSALSEVEALLEGTPRSWRKNLGFDMVEKTCWTCMWGSRDACSIVGRGLGLKERYCKGDWVL